MKMDLDEVHDDLVKLYGSVIADLMMIGLLAADSSGIKWHCADNLKLQVNYLRGMVPQI